MHRTARPRRRRADAASCSASTRRISRALAERGRHAPAPHRSRRRSPARCSRRSRPGSLPARARHRGQRLVLPRPRRGAGSGGSRTTSWRARRSGTRRSGAIPAFTCAKLFWWYNMYSSADFAVTPRPHVPGRRAQDPGHLHRAGRRCATSCSAQLGAVPARSISGARGRTSARRRWIAACATHVFDDAAADADARLPAAPRLRPAAARARPPGDRRATSREVDAVCGELIDHVRARGARVVVLSEYGITDGERRRAHQPRAARGRAAARCATSSGCEKLDAGASRGVRGRRPSDRARLRAAARARIAEVKRAARGARRRRARCSTRTGKRARGLDHPRSGELVAIADARSLVHATTTGSTTRARPTSRAPSTSTASPATTRSSCSSIPRCASRRSKVGWTLAAEGSSASAS